MDLVKNFFELTRGYSISAALAPCVVIFSYAHYSINYSTFNFILLVLALCLLQMCANLFDDYIDIKSKLEQGIALENITFINRKKARLIIEGKLSIAQVEQILTVMLVITALIGLYFVFFSGLINILFAFVGLICILFYPKSSRYYLAEAIVGFAFGPLMINAGYYALTGEFDSNLFLFSWAIFLTTIILLHTHNIMDWEFDIKEGKNTLAIACGSKVNAIKAQGIMIILAYLIVVFGVFNLNFNPHMLYVFLTLPIATQLQKSIKDYINIKDVKFIPKWYYGPFENWDVISQEKIDYFMYRFYLARNFGLFFAIFASIGAVV